MHNFLIKDVPNVLEPGAQSTDLSPEVMALDPSARTDLPSFKNDELWEVVDYCEPPQLRNLAEAFALVRGEKPGACGCVEGAPRQVYRHRATGTVVRITFAFDEEHLICKYRDAWAKHQPAGPAWIPSRFAGHRTPDLTPHPRSPLSTTSQMVPIGRLPGLVASLSGDRLRSWLLVGPTGCSKSTYISAVLNDLYTIRWCWANNAAGEHYQGSNLNRMLGRPEDRSFDSKICIWRVKVPDWLVEMSLHDTRDFGGPPVADPSITVEKIRDQSDAADVAPVLWLEEVDKFNPTRARLNYLYRLVDGVYEMGGTVIASANFTLSELKDHLGEAIYRRIAGTNDDDGEYTIMDFHDLIKMDKRARTRTSKVP